MQAAALVPLSDYLGQAYHPDCEYIDGILLKRNVGEIGDRATEIQDKIDDYLAFGVPCVWVIRPEARRAWIHTNDGAHEAKDGVLRNPVGDIAVPLSAIFTDQH